MALNLDDINKQKKTFSNKKSSSDEKEVSKKRPWKDFEKEEDLLDLVTARPSKKKTIAKDFKKHALTEEDKVKRNQKKKELEENKKRGISSELQLKIKKISKEFFSDIN